MTGLPATPCAERDVDPVRFVVQLDSVSDDHLNTALLLARVWGELDELDLALLRLVCTRSANKERP